MWSMVESPEQKNMVGYPKVVKKFECSEVLFKACYGNQPFESMVCRICTLIARELDVIGLVESPVIWSVVPQQRSKPRVTLLPNESGNLTSSERFKPWSWIGLPLWTMQWKRRPKSHWSMIQARMKCSRGI